MFSHHVQPSNESRFNQYRSYETSCSILSNNDSIILYIHRFHHAILKKEIEEKQTDAYNVLKRHASIICDWEVVLTSSILMKLNYYGIKSLSQSKKDLGMVMGVLMHFLKNF